MTLSFTPADMRRTILRMAYSGQAVHVGCSFSIVEIVHSLYSEFIRFNPANVNDPTRDILALSKGHGVMACYAALYGMNAIHEEDIENYFKDGSSLKGLSSVHCPGIEVSGGSLGHGLTVATGLALAAKWRKSDRRVFCIVGDGELNEGSIWESLMFAAHHKLSNLTVIVDANNFQAMGRPSEILDLEPLSDKLRAFRFSTKEVDGHNQLALQSAMTELLKENMECPKAIIARTIKGKGVTFMEDDNSWHYSRLNAETYERALSELNK